MNLHRVVTVGKELQVQKLARNISEELFVADDTLDALDIAGNVNPELIIFDHHFKPAHIREFLDAANEINCDIPVVVVGSGNEKKTDWHTEFIEAGICNYLNDWQDKNRLEQIINKIKNVPVQQETKSHLEQDFFAESCADSFTIVGQSQATRDKLKMIKLVAASRCNPVLIIGETGTGKELAARAIHHLRHPKEEFVAVNCAALTANLLESELFGHVKGSFTGADREKTGLLELAGNGALFLDEISEMPMDLQAKLLRVLQERTFRKVGGVKNIACNATIIASSNRNLYKEAQENRFRRDLYYRLNICPIAIAPLRAVRRKKDIKMLAEYFLRMSTVCPEKVGKINSFTGLAIEALQKHDWPGNVRELKNVVERAIILETTDKIGLTSIIINTSELFDLPDKLETTDSVGDFSLAQAERGLIEKALQETGWQKTKAASLLGITRATLYAKLRQYNIEKGSYVAAQAKNEDLQPSSYQFAETA